MNPEKSQVATVVADAASVDAAIQSRFSCRAFLRNREVDRQLIEEILDVARRAASGTNTQPWNVYVLQGAARDTLVDKVCAAHDAIYQDPSLVGEYREEYDYYPEKWVSPYIDRRRENGWSLYGLLGIWAIPIAGLTAAAGLVIELALGVVALGRAFDRMDVSSEGPGAP